MSAQATSGVRLRRARPDDVPAIAAIWRDGWIDGHAGHVPALPETRRRAESWSAQVTGRLPHTWLVHEARSVVGFLVVVDDELQQVYVDHSVRGTGIATVLLRHGEALVRRAGFTTAWLAVAAGNARARRFYEREAWKDTGHLDYRARTGSGTVIVPVRRYEKSVSRTVPAPQDAAR